MDYKIVEQPEFHVVGITVTTTADNQEINQTLFKLWDRYFREGINKKIPNSIDNEVLNTYTNLKKQKKGQTIDVLIGKRVKFIDKKLPKGLTGVTIPAQTYAVFTAKGELPTCVQEMWEFINLHDNEFERTSQGDFDVYGGKTTDPQNAEVDIYVGINL